MAKMYQRVFETKKLSTEEAKEILQFNWIEGLLKFFKDDSEYISSKMFTEMFIGNLDMENANIDKEEWSKNILLKRNSIEKILRKRNFKCGLIYKIRIIILRINR